METRDQHERLIPKLGKMRLTRGRIERNATKLRLTRAPTKKKAQKCDGNKNRQKKSDALQNRFFAIAQ
jgi:hypothetical protein